MGLFHCLHDFALIFAFYRAALDEFGVLELEGETARIVVALPRMNRPHQVRVFHALDIVKITFFGPAQMLLSVKSFLRRWSIPHVIGINDLSQQDKDLFLSWARTNNPQIPVLRADMSGKILD